MRFAVLSSSRGTTFQAILDRIADGSLSAMCLALIADRSDRRCVARAKAAGVPIIIVEKRDGESREEFDARLHEALLSLGHIDVIAAIGWMHIFSPLLIAKWKDRILNVHPSLLPKYGGKGMYGSRVHEAVLASGDTESGMTIHFVDEEVDTGKMVLQKTCPVLPGDTVETLKARVQELEKKWYPRVLGDMKF